MPKGDCTRSVNRYGWHQLGPVVVAKWQGQPTLVQRCTSEWESRKGHMRCTFYCPAPTQAPNQREAFGASAVPMDIDPDLRAAESLARLAEQPLRQPVAQPVPAAAPRRKRAADREAGPGEPDAVYDTLPRAAQRARIEGHGMYRAREGTREKEMQLDLSDAEFMELMATNFGPRSSDWPAFATDELEYRMRRNAYRSQPPPLEPVYGPEAKDYTSLRVSEDWRQNANFEMALAEGVEWPWAPGAVNESWHHGRRDILHHMGVGSSSRSAGVLSDTARRLAGESVRDYYSMQSATGYQPGPLQSYIPSLAMQGEGAVVTAGTMGPNLQLDDLPIMHGPAGP